MALLGLVALIIYNKTLFCYKTVRLNDLFPCNDTLIKLGSRHKNLTFYVFWQRQNQCKNFVSNSYLPEYI